jgi:hypothetical protein
MLSENDMNGVAFKEYSVIIDNCWQPVKEVLPVIFKEYHTGDY